MSIVSSAISGLECGVVRIGLTQFADIRPPTKCPQIIIAIPRVPQDDVLQLTFSHGTPIYRSKDQNSSEWLVFSITEGPAFPAGGLKCKACPERSRSQARPHINDRPASSLVPTSGAEGVCGARRVQSRAGQRLALDEVGCGHSAKRRSSSSAGRSLRRGDGMPHTTTKIHNQGLFASEMVWYHMLIKDTRSAEGPK